MSGESDGRNWAEIFTETFATAESGVDAQVWAEVFGEEYPADLAPHSFTSRSELARVADEVRAGSGDLLVDVGSGRGGPGLWVAGQTGADYLAVDIASSGLAEVRRRAEQVGLGPRVEVAPGSFDSVPLADGEAAAVMSIDALLFAPDKAAAINELVRTLRPGGRLVLTTWDYHRQPVGRPPQVSDHRPLLAAAGLEVHSYDETPDWERRQRETARLLLERVSDIAAETGEAVDVIRDELAEMAATVDCMTRRILIVAERPA